MMYFAKWKEVKQRFKDERECDSEYVLKPICENELLN